MLLYVTTWLKITNDGKKILVYCSDVSGAFDRVCSARLLAKLASLGLHRDLFGVVKSWLNERQAFVVVAGARSAGSALSKMVYQGTVFGPSLWNSFVGDASIVFECAGFCIVIYANNFNAFKPYHRSLSNTAILVDLRSRQLELY